MAKKSGESIIQNIKDNYKKMEEGIVKQLYFSENHGGIVGHYREKIWAQMFQNIIPKKFVIEQSVFIIDSYGKVSKEVDLAIFDEMYTPYVFKYYDLKFIPIEAVAVVVQCKSKNMKTQNLKEWKESISNLHTSSRSLVRIQSCLASGGVPTQTATRPLCILCCLNNELQNLTEFDAIIRANKEENRLNIQWDKTKKDLYAWYEHLNHADGTDKKRENKENEKEDISTYSLEKYTVQDNGRELSLMTFNFQLNQLLMLINNPMLFPHIAYAEMFSGHDQGGTEDE